MQNSMYMFSRAMVFDSVSCVEKDHMLTKAWCAYIDMEYFALMLELISNFAEGGAALTQPPPLRDQMHFWLKKFVVL